MERDAVAGGSEPPDLELAGGIGLLVEAGIGTPRKADRCARTYEGAGNPCL